jgi:Protein required for attachment to host cells
MTAPVVGIGTLRRLSELASDGHPVLSAYLNLGTAGAQTPAAAARGVAIEALMSGVEQRAGKANADRVRELLSAPGLAHGTRSLAAFSSVAGSSYQVAQLPCEVEPMAVLDTIPWLEPLAGMFAAGDWGGAVLGRRTARLLRGDPRMLVEFAAVPDGLHSTRAPGVCTQPHGPRLTEEHIAERARHVAALLMRAHRRQAFEHLAVAAPHEVWLALEDALHRDLRDRLTGFVALDLEHAPTREITRALASVVAQSEREQRERRRRSTITGPRVRGTRITADQTTTRYLQQLSRRQDAAGTLDPPAPAVLPRPGGAGQEQEAVCP